MRLFLISLAVIGVVAAITIAVPAGERDGRPVFCNYACRDAQIKAIDDRLDDLDTKLSIIELQRELRR